MCSTKEIKKEKSVPILDRKKYDCGNCSLDRLIALKTLDLKFTSAKDEVNDFTF